MQIAVKMTKDGRVININPTTRLTKRQLENILNTSVKREKIEEALKTMATLKLFQGNAYNCYQRYQAGELGDDMDFIEWLSTIEMLASITQQLALSSGQGSEHSHSFG